MIAGKRDGVFQIRLFVCGALCWGTIATAGAAHISSVILEIEATNAHGIGTLEIISGAPSLIDGSYHWSLDGPLEIVDLGTGAGETVIASLETASIAIDADPLLALSFAVHAGGSATTFTISSPLLSFAPIAPAQARATATITATDNAGDGVFYTGGYLGGTRSYQASYNGLIPSGTLFANLVGNAAIGTMYGSVTGNEDLPLGGGFAGLASVSSMSTQYKFTVGAQDGASGTSTFVVVPEPSALALVFLTLGSYILVFRRR